MTLGTAERRDLLALARESIASSLPHGIYQAYPAKPVSAILAAPGSSFVTLRIGPALRGCCGSIEVRKPLAEDVWRAAWASAFSDPRFPALTEPEWRQASLHISVLTPPQPLPVASEAELLSQLEPHVDGVILELGATRATFLPAVWEQLPEPALFLRHLKTKAGWAEDFWSPQVRVKRYRTQSFGESEADPVDA